MAKQLSFKRGSSLLVMSFWLVRTVSVSSGTRIGAFRDAIRERDKRCVITGEVADDRFWWDFQAAHIFPLVYEGHWGEFNHGRWTTISPATESAGPISSTRWDVA